MFRHYPVTLRQPAINTLPSYTSISNAPVGNTVYSSAVPHISMPVLILQSLKSQYYKIFKTLKLSCFSIKLAEIILLLQFSVSQSVRWLYGQSVTNMHFIIRMYKRYIAYMSGVFVSFMSLLMFEGSMS